MGMVMLVKDEQFLKASFPMEVTEFGMEKPDSKEQPRKASFPMAVTRYECPLYVTVSGIIKKPVTIHPESLEFSLVT